MQGARHGLILTDTSKHFLWEVDSEGGYLLNFLSRYDYTLDPPCRADCIPEEKRVKTYVPKAGEINNEWRLIDAEGQVLGRVAVEAAMLLRGKHKPQYTPYLDCGDHVIVINAAKAVVTGGKEEKKKYYRHSGYPGGIREMTYRELMEKHPARAMELAIKGMLPHNRLGRKLGTNFRVYAGSEHPHEAQQPIVHEMK